MGYWATGGSFWAAYFAPSDPEREVVYGLDTAGGIDVLHIDRGAPSSTVTAPTEGLGQGVSARYRAHKTFGMACPLAG